MGMTYVDKKGITRKGRAIKPPCMPTCAYGCSLNFDDSARQQIFTHFWSLTKKEKENFYLQYILQVQPKRRYTKEKNVSRRSCSFIYYLKLRDVNLQVCKIFFLNTLGVSSAPIYRTFSQKNTAEAQ